MSITFVTKLKLKTGSTLKCATIRPSQLDYSAGTTEVNFAEQYITSFGTDINDGLAAGSVRTFLLNTKSTETANNRLEFSTGPIVSVWKGPSPEALEEYKGVKSFTAASYFVSSGQQKSGLFLTSGWSVEDLMAPEGATWMIGFAYDEDVKIAWMFVLNENPTYREEGYGHYTLRTVRTFSEEQYNNFNAWLSGAYDTSTDPFEDNDDEDKGGDGDLDNISDPVEIPGLPSIGAIDTGFITLFNPTLSQLRNLADYMWSDTFDLDNFKKLFANPMDAILGLTMLPVNVPSVTSGPVKIGNISTGVTMNYVSNQYMKVNCGSINIKEFWGAYLDYNPLTKIHIYLPYIGTRTLSADDVMNKTIRVEYNVDVLTGACVAHILCGTSVLYEFAGQCGIQIPINGNNFNSMLNSAVSAAVAVGSAAVAIGASGGAATPVVAGATISGAGALANSVMNSKGEVQRSGSMGNSAGLLGHQKPYLIITRPRQCVASNQNKFEGYPSYQSKKLSNCSGYTQILQIHLENIPATDAEKLEIERLLMEGVII